MGNDLGLLLDGLLFKFVILILETGHVKVEVFNSFVELGEGLLLSCYFFVVEIVVNLKISLQTIDYGLILRDFRPEILRLCLLLLEPEIQIEHKLIIILALNLLIIHDIIHLFFEQLDVSMQLELGKLVLVRLVLSVRHEFAVLLLEDPVEFGHLPQAVLGFMELLDQVGRKGGSIEGGL